MLPQIDAHMKAAISLLVEGGSGGDGQQPSTSSASPAASGLFAQGEDRVRELILYMLGLLVMVPGHPELGPFYILQGLLTAVPKLPLTAAAALQIHTLTLALTSAYAQRTLVYRVGAVVGNDELYGQGEGYREELAGVTRTCVTETLRILHEMGAGGAGGAAQAKCALDLVNTLLPHYTLTPPLLDFAYKLIELASRAGAGNMGGGVYLRNTVAFVVRTVEASEFVDLINRVVPKFKALVK